MQVTHEINVVSGPSEDDGTAGGGGDDGNGNGGAGGGETVVVERIWDGGRADGTSSNSRQGGGSSTSLMPPPPPIPNQIGASGRTGLGRPLRPLPPPPPTASPIPPSPVSATFPPPTSSFLDFQESLGLTASVPAPSPSSLTPLLRPPSPPPPFSSGTGTGNESGSLHYLITISGRSFPIGGVIPIDITLMPLEKVRVHRVGVVIEQKIEYHTQFKKVERTDPILTVPLLSIKHDSPQSSSKDKDKELRHILPLESDDPEALRKSPLYGGEDDSVDEDPNDLDLEASDSSEFDDVGPPQQQRPTHRGKQTKQRGSKRNLPPNALSSLASSLMGPGPWTLSLALPVPLCHVSNLTPRKVREHEEKMEAYRRQQQNGQDDDDDGFSAGGGFAGGFGYYSKRDGAAKRDILSTKKANDGEKKNNGNKGMNKKEKKPELVDVGRGLLPSNKNKRSNVAISHLLKCVVRIERGELEDSDEEVQAQEEENKSNEEGARQLPSSPLPGSFTTNPSGSGGRGRGALADADQSGWDDEWEYVQSNKEVRLERESRERKVRVQEPPKPTPRSKVKPKKKRKLFDIVVQTPIQILSCRCNPEFASLPGYSPHHHIDGHEALLSSSGPSTASTSSSFNVSSMPSNSSPLPSTPGAGPSTLNYDPIPPTSSSLSNPGENSTSLLPGACPCIIKDRMRQASREKKLRRRELRRELREQKRELRNHLPGSLPLLPPPLPTPIDLLPSSTKGPHQQRTSFSSSSTSYTTNTGSTSRSSYTSHTSHTNTSIISGTPSILRNGKSKRSSGFSGLGFGGIITARPTQTSSERRSTGGSQISQASQLPYRPHSPRSQTSVTWQPTSASGSPGIGSEFEFGVGVGQGLVHSSREFEDLVAGHMNEAGEAPPTYDYVALLSAGEHERSH
ncbi:hypothetical protein F5050DRAFT_1353486 [Lentinula boryana]|uniref:Arrestin C-terminal-like domain-containing protein n=1 Tax=Lentinula boryana TaxID=40481 RepID=A0ABQ8QHA3_9AGAR|nr:hypothetical protein F5050DRAFT_1353486 [Lentinula boryana]